MHQHHDSGWIILKFQSDEDRQHVLLGGPYKKFGRQLHLKQIPKHFNFNTAEMSIVPVWIKLPNWPMEVWSEEGVGYFCSLIGEPICSDALSLKKSAASYVRALVHIDAAKPLRKVIPMEFENGDRLEQVVEYENPPKYCSHCKTLGHNTITCSKMNNDQPANGGKDSTVMKGKEVPGKQKK